MTSSSSSRASKTTEPSLSSQSSIISSVNDQVHDEEQYPGEGSPTSLHVIVNDEEQNVERAQDELQSSKSPDIVQDWWGEIVGAFFSLGCALAIGVVLVSADDEPLRYWNFPISPNALIAIFSALSKAAIMMPVASCISYLKWVHFMKNPHPLADFQVYENASRGPWGSLNLLWITKGKKYMETWGAFITILALGMEPLVQAIIVYPQGQIYLGGEATFLTVHKYDTRVNWDEDDSLIRGSDNQIVDFSIQGAILNVLFDLHSPVEVNCPTGTCTWPKFTTLAICSNCRSVTFDSQIDCTSSPELGTFCTYTTPEGLIVTALSNKHNGYTEYTSTGRLPYQGNGVPLNNTLLSFASAEFSYMSDITKPGTIIECEIKWCAQTFHNLRVTNGAFSAGRVTEIPLESRSGYDTNGLCSLNPSNVNSDVVGDDTFLVNPMDSQNIARNLFSILNTTSRSNYGNILMSSSNLSETLADITRSITYALSMGSSSNETLGTAFRNGDRTIHVRWIYATFPLSVVAMGIAFFAWTLFYISFNKSMSWKSSNIVPLLAEAELWDEPKVSTSCSESELTRRARDIHGVFEMRETGTLVFVQCNVGKRKG